MGLKLLSSSASGSTSDAVEAFYYAVNNGADVLSNSWGGEYYSQSMENAINYAYIQGVLVVASAGNKGTTSTQYPAFYDHVVAVAATNSNDEKAPFSTYGNWVEIAAPGVDVLSLRASGTSMGTVYNSYTTIASGTSMACPHVSGACALLLSLYPEGTVDEVTNTLKDSADPVEPRVCQSGRLNIDKAILKTVKSEGKIWMNKEVYSCSGIIEIFVADSDLKGAGTEDVGLSTDGNDFETLTLLENGTNTGIFCGDIGLSSDGVVVEDGTLQVGHGQMITATYDDVNDGTGNPATVEDSAMVDCLIPVVLDVNVMLSLTGRSATVRIEADEPTLAEVSCGFGCGGPYDIIRTDSIISTNHTIKLLPLTSGTDYYFVIGLTDTAGNEVVDNNGGQCYWFTPEFLGFLVPSVYPTIQSAINDANDGDEVVVADGTYTGEGNREISFLGKAITVRSENGPENCIIDCNDAWFGFAFGRYADANSVLDGFTVTNAKIGIDCDYASPTITNCIITGNTGYTGIDCRWRSKPTIDNCIISNNNWRQWGPMCAGITCDGSSPTITNCTISNNIAEYNGGGIYCIGDAHDKSEPNIINCIISGNSAEYDGGGIYHSYLGSPKITNCTFIGNSAGHNGGAIYLGTYSSTTIINCTLIGNLAEQDGGAIYLKDISSGRNDPTIVNCAFSGNSAGSNGGGIWNGSYKCTLTGCTLSGNSSGLTGGGIFCDSDRLISLTNCILWGNVDSGAPIHPCQIIGGTPEVLFSCIQDDDPNDTDIPFGDANGNIDDNPLFVRNPDDGGDGWGVGDNDDFGDLHLQKISPCINTGLPNFIAGPNTVDIDGQPRIIGLRIDMGADEYEKMIVVTIPQGGEVWSAGSTHEIQWSSYGAGAVDILLSADSGGAWRTIESSAPDTESYIWHLPNRTDSNQCVISVIPGIPDANVITVESGSFEIRRYSGPASLPRRPRPPGPKPGEQYGPEFGCVKWMFETDGPVTSAVTVGRKIGRTTKAYIACEDGKLYALDVETGSLIWSYDINSPLLGSAAEGPQGAVYVGSTDGRLYAIDKEGRLLWTHTTEEPIYSTPVVSPQGRIYICSQDGTLYALARDGSELWCFETDGSGVTAGSIFATPATADDSTVYIGGLYDPNLYALNPDDGSIKWNCNFVRAVDISAPGQSYSQIIEKGGWPFASPVIAEDGTIYQGLVYDANLYAIDPNDGSKIWSTSLAGLILRYGPAFEDHIIWYGAGEPPEDINGQPVHSITPYLYASCWSKPALAPDGTIYVSFDDPYLRAVDPNGGIKWMERLGEVGGFTLTVGSDGLIYAASDDANLYVVDPNGEITAQFEGDDWLSHPVIAPDRTIIVSDANNIVWAISENSCDGQELVLDTPASPSEPNEQKTKDLPTETILRDDSRRRQNAGGNR